MANRRDDIFKALADPHRRQILAALCRKPMVAGELARLVSLAPNALSFHLNWLRSAGLVSVHREGRFLRYQVEAGLLAIIQKEVRRLFGAGLDLQAVKPKSSPQKRAQPVRSKRRRSANPKVTPPSVSVDDSFNAPLPTELL